MKIAVVNFSGNVGKTTIATHLLAPRMPDADLVEVETVNSGSGAEALSVKRIRGNQYANMQEIVLLGENVVVDVGASNVETWLKQMHTYRGSHGDFDLYLVPVTREEKQQADTILTIKQLAKLGVPPRKIQLILNKIETDDDVEGVFDAMWGFLAAEKLFTWKPEARVFANEVYERLMMRGLHIGQVTGDKTDYKAKLKDAKTPAEKSDALELLALQRLAGSAQDNLDVVFKAVVK